MDTIEQAKLLGLTEIQGIGSARAVNLVNHFGSVDSVYEASLSSFEGFYYITEEEIQELRDSEKTVARYRERIEVAADDDIILLTPFDNRYPERLREQHQPLIFFAKGNLDLLEADSVSFAGSRDANENALNWTERTATDFVESGYCIVSGGAFGVDRAAHEAALAAGGETILAAPSGHKNPYPGAHADLYREIEENGLVISHRFPEQDPARGGFIYRNKTNAGLGKGVVIAAAEMDSGTTAQFDIAIEQNRPVFVPSSDIGCKPYNGVEAMRGEGSVMVVETAQEVIEQINSGSKQPTLDEW